MALCTFTDMMGRQVTINGTPKRIVSLVPSQTELLYDLGLRDEVVGITKFCVHPAEWFRSKRRVGGTKTVHIDVVKELAPDLILANKEENTKEDIEALAAFCPVWVSDIKSLAEACYMLLQVGKLVGRASEAEDLNLRVTKGFHQLHTQVLGFPPSTKKQVAYLIWRKPWMCAGGDTFISDMLTRLGWENVLANMPRYPSIELEQLRDMQPGRILLSSEPYPFKEQHIAEIKAVLPHAQVMLVDGEMFSWYGSRLLLAPAYFATLLNDAG